MQKIFNLDRNDWKSVLKRPTQSMDAIEATVEAIFLEVRKKGDKAIKKFSLKYDGFDFDDMVVSKDEINEARIHVTNELKEAIALAKKNIETFHKAQITERMEVETMKDVLCWQEKRPIQKVGLYIPGGTAPLFSTILMLAVPANIAGCTEIVLCSPPNSKGKIDPAILYTSEQRAYPQSIRYSDLEISM